MVISPGLAKFATDLRQQCADPASLRKPIAEAARRSVGGAGGAGPLRNAKRNKEVALRPRLWQRDRQPEGCVIGSTRKRWLMSDRIEKHVELNAPVSRVWRALTDHREFGAWFRVKLDGPFAPGAVSRGHVAYPGYEHLRWEATVVAMEPERLFSFTWHPYAIDPKIDYSAEPVTLVEFRLEPKGNATVLTVTEAGFDAIPKERRFEAFRMNDQGWAIQMTNIAQHVAAAG
jgi:uncharacterized protein YndB with AHSA1/START domain